MTYKKIIGIYKIENIENGKVYIGQSSGILNRWANHKSSLRNGVHENSYLQRSWNKYGEDSFDFTILQKCSEDELDDLEILYISKFDSFKNGYNLTEGGNSRRGFKLSEQQKQRLRDFHTGRKASEETRLKMSASRIGKCYVGKGGDSHLAKKVVCLNTHKVYNSIIEASTENKISSIHKCCNGKINHSGQDADGIYLVWRYYDDYIKLQDCKNIVGKINRKRMFINIDDMEIITYAKLNKLGVSPATMRNACDGITKSVLIDGVNKRVMYYYDYILYGDTTSKIVGKEAVSTSNKIKVICTTTGEIFSSMKEGAEKYAIKTFQKIGMCCRGERKSCGKLNDIPLVWEYYHEEVTVD